MLNIYTERLELKALSYDVLCAIMNNDKIIIEDMGYKMNKNWPSEDIISAFPYFEQKMKSKQIKGFDIWMIIKKDSGTIIGDIGFKGEPNELGEIEIGYAIVKDERCKGYCFEAVQALINWAFKHEKVKCIKAECLIDNMPSKRVLEKVGMTELKRDNKFIYWEVR